MSVDPIGMRRKFTLGCTTHMSQQLTSLIVTKTYRNEQSGIRECKNCQLFENSDSTTVGNHAISGDKCCFEKKLFKNEYIRDINFLFYNNRCYTSFAVRILFTWKQVYLYLYLNYSLSWGTGSDHRVAAVMMNVRCHLRWRYMVVQSGAERCMVVQSGAGRRTAIQSGVGRCRETEGGVGRSRVA